ncbi:MAG: hypothetical protein K9M08_15795 [Pirellula sp.]|nr:hypothetical protein [Pirellula sp.]
MSFGSSTRWCLVGLSLLILSGCSGETLEPVYPVSGTITQKGKPVEGAIVAFTPLTAGNGLPASGISNAAGVYKLTTRNSGDGAAVGKYRISVAKYDKKLEPKKSEGSEKLADPYDITNEYPTGYNEMQASEIAASLSKNLLHPKYSDPSTSKFEADVTKGANSFDFKVD